jgi:hypothetical protein
VKYYGSRVTGMQIDRNRICTAILNFMRIDPARNWGVSDMTRIHQATRTEVKACLRRLVTEGHVQIVRHGTTCDETLYRLISTGEGSKPTEPGAA